MRKLSRSPNIVTSLNMIARTSAFGCVIYGVNSATITISLIPIPPEAPGVIKPATHAIEFTPIKKSAKTWLLPQKKLFKNHIIRPVAVKNKIHKNKLKIRFFHSFLKLRAERLTIMLCLRSFSFIPGINLIIR